MNILEFGEKLGIKKEETDKILVEIKENSTKLDGCILHDFSVPLDRHTKQPINNPTPAQTFGAKWKCNNCGGVVDAAAKRWYNIGVEHMK